MTRAARKLRQTVDREGQHMHLGEEWHCCDCHKVNLYGGLYLAAHTDIELVFRCECGARYITHNLYMWRENGHD